MAETRLADGARVGAALRAPRSVRFPRVAAEPAGPTIPARGAARLGWGPMEWAGAVARLGVRAQSPLPALCLETARWEMARWQVVAGLELWPEPASVSVGRPNEIRWADEWAGPWRWAAERAWKERPAFPALPRAALREAFPGAWRQARRGQPGRVRHPQQAETWAVRWRRGPVRRGQGRGPAGRFRVRRRMEVPHPRARSSGAACTRRRRPASWSASFCPQRPVREASPVFREP
jgi:hypothetical protein